MSYQKRERKMKITEKRKLQINHTTINVGHAIAKKEHFIIHGGYAKLLQILERNTSKHFENSENRFKLKPQIFYITYDTNI